VTVAGAVRRQLQRHSRAGGVEGRRLDRVYGLRRHGELPIPRQVAAAVN